MRNIYKYGILGISLMILNSCIDTLDTRPTTSFDDETVWGSKATVEGFINSTYDAVINSGYAGSGSSISWEARTPNGVLCSQVGEGIDNVATELGLSTGNDWGVNRFGLLRKVNMIITNVQNSSTLNETEKIELKAHGNLMRGMIFFDQARKMGRFVPVKEVFTVENPEAVNIPMTEDVSESYKLIIEDLQIAANDLPIENASGLPTRWAAGVLLSRAALQAYAYTGDASYLDVAITAADDVISNSGVELSNSNGLFNETDLYNPEILWGYYREKENTYVSSFEELMRTYPNVSTDNVINSQSPVALKQANGQTFEGWAIYFPTQDMVDQFLVTDEETGALTPEGNLTLVDDYHTSYSDGSGQQFITLVSKSGNTFYLVIDRNDKGENTVHFMNLVDESDLLSLMEEDAADAYTAEKEAAAQAEQERKQAEEDAKKAAEEAAASGSEQTGGNKVTKYAATFLGVLALVGLAAGGGIYTFMKQKQKKQAEKEALDPDADYTEDKGDFEIPVEDEPEETGEEDNAEE